MPSQFAFDVRKEAVPAQPLEADRVVDFLVATLECSRSVRVIGAQSGKWRP
jgi:hypothetical protein